MRLKLIKAIERGQVIEMMYLSKDGAVSKRRIKVLRIEGECFWAYCFLRRTKRKFLIDNVLALAPVLHKGRDAI